MSSFSSTLLSGLQTGWGMAEGVRDNRNRAEQQARQADQQAFDNDMRTQQMLDERAWRAEQSQLRQQIVEDKMRQRHLDRRLWGAINAPAPKPLPGVAKGEGQENYTAEVPQHPMDAITIDEISQASPEVQRAYVASKEDSMAFEKKKQDAELYIKWANANGNMNRTFFVDKNGKNSHALQTVIDAGMFDRLDQKQIHSSARDEQASADWEVEYLAGGRPEDHPEDPDLAQRHAMFTRMDPRLRTKMAETTFLAKEQAKRLEPVYKALAANPMDAHALAVLAANNAPKPPSGGGLGGSDFTSQTRVSVAGIFNRMARMAEKEANVNQGMIFRSAAAAALAGNILPDGAVVLNGGAPSPDGTIEVVTADGRFYSHSPEYFRQLYGPAAGPGPQGAAQPEAPAHPPEVTDPYIDGAMQDDEADPAGAEVPTDPAAAPDFAEPDPATPGMFSPNENADWLNQSEDGF